MYNRQNPFFISVEYNSQGERRLTQLSLLPILPHLNYQISFWSTGKIISPQVSRIALRISPKGYV
jgi:hypothetical protein